ncbi:MAG: hybrid sensor histidine kinase/response regulator [Deltaproteobacteria bacterium]
MNGKLSLLVADDEPLIRRRVRMMLDDRFRVEEVATAESARLAAQQDYDAILLDIVFPDGNGIDICRELKAREPHMTVVISSSLETVDAWNQAFQAGADGYLEKRELLGLDPRKIVLTICNLVERNHLRQLTEETNRRQAELLSVLSHDVRAPFQALLGTIQLLRKSRIPEDAAGNVDTLYGCAREQLAFINSLLELLRLESGSDRVRRYPVDINVPVNQCLQSLGVLAGEKEIALSADLQPNLPPVEADLGKLSQLMNNFVSNAIKFTPRGGSIVVTTRDRARKETPGVEIRVQDTGKGIPPQDREKIFQRFGRVRERGTEGEKGTGLGLSICRQIIELHGGTIEISSGERGGTVVRAWLPLHAASDNEISSPSAGRTDEAHTTRPHVSSPGSESLRTGAS